LIGNGGSSTRPEDPATIVCVSEQFDEVRPAIDIPCEQVVPATVVPGQVQIQSITFKDLVVEGVGNAAQLRQSNVLTANRNQSS
jgi:hypothetical protein